MSAMTLPLVLTKLSYLIDNPWSVSQARADMAGLILADSIIDRNLGTRPITLVGFSLGARVIYAALRELQNRGAFGLVQNVYMFGTPIVANTEEYIKIRTVVPGRFVNGYATNDWILGMPLDCAFVDLTNTLTRLPFPCHRRRRSPRCRSCTHPRPHHREHERHRDGARSHGLPHSDA